MSQPAEVVYQRGVPLAPRTTLGLGGPAEVFCEVASVAQLTEALTYADREGMRATLLAGGSNVVIADTGLQGLCIVLKMRGMEFIRKGDVVHARVMAGEALDDFVAETVRRDLAGVACLSGVPGSVGATPIQNVGAYGAEVADCIVSVELLERATGQFLTMTREECDFGYRDSRFRRQPGRYVVLAVTFELVPGGETSLRYGELFRALGAQQARPSLPQIRSAVLDLRRAKSMVLDPADENGHSAGSFFKNPVLDEIGLAHMQAQALKLGLIKDPTETPTYPDGARTKVAAGFLIERAGFNKGYALGPVAVSTKHALCLTNRGGAKTGDLLRLAREIQDRVRARFGVPLQPEPVFLGFAVPPLDGAVLG